MLLQPNLYEVPTYCHPGLTLLPSVCHILPIIPTCPPSERLPSGTHPFPLFPVPFPSFTSPFAPCLRSKRNRQQKQIHAECEFSAPLRIEDPPACLCSGQITEQNGAPTYGRHSGGGSSNSSNGSWRKRTRETMKGLLTYTAVAVAAVLGPSVAVAQMDASTAMGTRTASTTRMTSTTASSATGTATHSVKVGLDHKYVPNSIDAEVGDIIGEWPRRKSYPLCQDDKIIARIAAPGYAMATDSSSCFTQNLLFTAQITLWLRRTSASHVFPTT